MQKICYIKVGVNYLIDSQRWQVRKGLYLPITTRAHISRNINTVIGMYIGTYNKNLTKIYVTYVISDKLWRISAHNYYV